MQIFVWLILLILPLFEILVEVLNLKSIRNEIHPEFQEIYSKEKYVKSQEYLKVNTKHDVFEIVVMSVLTVLFFYYGGFGKLDDLVRSYSNNFYINGLLYFFILAVLSFIISEPFKLYSTFVIEEKFGFNKMNIKTYITDFFKGLLLSIILGVPVMLLVLWFFQNYELAWIYCWASLTILQLVLLFVAPTWIMPLFNKFTPLEDGILKQKINEFSLKNNFKISGIYVMDGSKRSSKANAFFTGFGKNKRIVLFDTLIKNHTEDELIAILAHEIGHYQLKHIWRQILISLFSTAFMFYIFSLFLNNKNVFDVFQVKELSIYCSLVFFGLFYSPVSSLLSLYSLFLSRKYEFEADKYSFDTFGKPLELSMALKKLSVDNLSNLNPHPIKVFWEYSHPPVLSRVHELNLLAKSQR